MEPLDRDAMEESSGFYRGMAEELSSLARLSAEIQWAPDVPLRAKRPVAPRVASTGRLPREPRPAPPRAAPRPAPERRVERRDPPPVARNVPEVSTKRPPHLTVPNRRTARRGLQPPQGRRLRLGARAAKPSSSPEGERLPEATAPVATSPAAIPVPVPAVPAVPAPAVPVPVAPVEVVSRAVSVQEDLLSPRAESDVAHTAFSEHHEAEYLEGVLASVPPRPQVQLLEVMDLQLFVPSAPAVGSQLRAQEMPKKEISVSSHSSHVQPQPASPRAKADQGLRALLLDVINDMRLQPPASQPSRPPKAPVFSEGEQSVALAQASPPLFEEVAEQPPPSEAEPPAPSSSETEEMKLLKTQAELECKEKVEPPAPSSSDTEEMKLLKTQAELECKEKALGDSRAEAQAQAKHLADVQQKAQEQSLALAEVQATFEAQVHSQREQTNHLIQTVQQSEAAQRSLQEALQRLQEMQEQLAAGLERDNKHELHQRLERLEALLEGRFSETLRAMSSQSQERAAFVTALAEQRSAPMQMLPLCIPQPAPAAPPPPPKVSVAAQTTEDNRKEHEARVARFTHYLLHGPPGAATSSLEPRINLRDTHAEARLAMSLRDSMKREMKKEKAEKVDRVARSSPATSSSDSVGHVRRVVQGGNPGERSLETGSPGEVTWTQPLGGPPSEGQECSGGEISGSEGEVYGDASFGEVSHGELEVDKDSNAISSGEISSFT